MTKRVMKSDLAPVIAHRGGRYYAPENTIQAFERAYQDGGKWIEFDVQLTSDHQPVVTHDDDLNRIYHDTRRVHDLTWSDLELVQPVQEGSAIPSLDEVLTSLMKHAMFFNLEIKANFNDREYTKANSHRALDVLEHYPKLKERVLISSFGMEALYVAKERMDDVPRALLFEFEDWNQDWVTKSHLMAEHYQALDGFSININDEGLSQERVAMLLEITDTVMVYTVNDVARANELFSWGVTSIFSDDTMLLD